jgi:hypothetical protein
MTAIKLLWFRNALKNVSVKHSLGFIGLKGLDFLACHP